MFAAMEMKSINISDFCEHLIHGGQHVTLTCKLGAEDFHHLALSQLFVLSLNLAFFTEDEGILAVRITVLIETLGTDGVTTDQSVRVGLGEILQAGQARKRRFDWLETDLHLFVNGLHGSRDFGQLVVFALFTS